MSVYVITRACMPVFSTIMERVTKTFPSFQTEPFYHWINAGKTMYQQDVGLEG